MKVKPCIALTAMVWCLFCTAFASWAAPLTFVDLEPGLSKKSEADSVLGKPVKEIVPGIRYDYHPQLDTRRISIKYRAGSGVIEAIDLYSQIGYSKNEYRDWLYLDDPEKIDHDEKNYLVEQYTSSGVIIHFAGPDDSFPVECVTYFDPTPEKLSQNQCSKFVGTWIWFNGAKVMCDSTGYCKAANGYEGPWTCLEAGKKFQIKWGYKGGKTQYLDTVSLSPNGLELKGRNQQGGAIGARRE